MDNEATGTSSITQRYIERTPKSRALAERAIEVFPSGVTHDMRFIKPYGIAVERALGSRKWDIDGNEYIDYVGGHGGHILGHGHPKIVKAVQDAITRGTQVGANLVEEVEYGELIKEMVPCAERVRPTMSGTESTLLALRLARAYTGKNKIIQIRTNFHGWHDSVASSYQNLPTGQVARGVVPAIGENTVLVPPRDIDTLKTVLDNDDDIAGMILEPTGTHFGLVPLPPGYLQAVRELTAAKGVVLIFDEVISGFRVSPGGAQAYYGVTPDMSTHAKIVAGGLPGGVVCGRKDILDLLDFEVMLAKNEEKILHNGTFNANLVSAAAGIEMLKLVRDTDACERANATAAKIREELVRVFSDLRLNWAIYGEFSSFCIFTNPTGLDIDPANFNPLDYDYKTLKTIVPATLHKMLICLMNYGIHCIAFPGGLVSSAHTDDDVEQTIEAFRRAMQALKDE